MAVKSIISVEVDDSKFKKFKKEVDDHSKTVTDLPDAWKDVDKALDKLARNFTVKIGSIDGAIGKISDHLSDLADAFGKATKNLASNLDKISDAFADSAAHAVDLSKNLEKVSKEQSTVNHEQQAFNRHVIASKRHFNSLGHTVSGVGKNIFSITKYMAKWSVKGLIGAGVGSGIGMFGLDSLADRVSGQRREAQGLNISSGQQQAFALNYGRVVDTNSLLHNVVNTRADLATRYAFNQLGVTDYMGKNAVALSQEVIDRARKVWDQGDHTSQYAQAHGLLQFFSMDELRRLGKTSAATMAQMKQGYARNVTSLTVDPAVQKQWQDFSIQMHRAGAQIEQVFVRGLAPLTPDLSRLSGAVEKTLAALLANPHLKVWIDDLAKGIGGLSGEINKFAKFLGSPEFNHDLTLFGQAVSGLAKATVNALRYFGLIPSAGADSGTGLKGRPTPVKDFDNWSSHGKNFLGYHDMGGKWVNHHNPGNLRSAPGVKTVNGFAMFPNDVAGMKAMAWQLRRYQTHDHLTTLNQIISKWAPASDHNDTAAYIRNVSHWTGYKPNQALDLNNPDTISKVMSAMTRQEGTGRYTPAQVRYDLALPAKAKPTKARVDVHIHNNTGAHVAVSAAAAAQ